MITEDIEYLSRKYFKNATPEECIKCIREYNSSTRYSKTDKQIIDKYSALDRIAYLLSNGYTLIKESDIKKKEDKK